MLKNKINDYGNNIKEGGICIKKIFLSGIIIVAFLSLTYNFQYVFAQNEGITTDNTIDNNTITDNNNDNDINDNNNDNDINDNNNGTANDIFEDDDALGDDIDNETTVGEILTYGISGALLGSIITYFVVHDKRTV